MGRHSLLCFAKLPRLNIWELQDWHLNVLGGLEIKLRLTLSYSLNRSDDSWLCVGATDFCPLLFPLFVFWWMLLLGYICGAAFVCEVSRFSLSRVELSILGTNITVFDDSFDLANKSLGSFWLAPLAILAEVMLWIPGLDHESLEPLPVFSCVFPNGASCFVAFSFRLPLLPSDQGWGSGFGQKPDPGLCTSN